ncbi:hypothetical protein CPB84DRAFT_1029131 [Gymnopilus junonius]|uniref:F-box domain-containing protein n=1 Tax=Gymnopilus junonius TaxID=109634 RepID=A0A9P5NQE0_GYMJU|nr:hypothetical protein CPB84DRAFT_1029131 [Gymnopilus junonius]
MAKVDLDEDILWRIFVMNADIYAPLEGGQDPVSSSPLTIARRSSQVCQSWRRLLLGSPSIWGRLIHLDHLGQSSNLWKHEVLRRTGNAPLYIRGVSIRRNAELFFFHIIDVEWTRIRRIDVKIKNEWHAEAWRPLLRPNPMLETFYLRYFDSSVSLGPEGNLFSDSAPFLREFSSPSIRFSLDAPWLSQIQHITISHKYPLSELLLAMKSMECLVHISIQDGFNVNSSQTTEPLSLSLPRLLYINLRGHPSACCRFLECITPAPGCGLRLALWELIISTDELRKFHKIFDRFLLNYIALYTPKCYQLGIQSNFFTLNNLVEASPLSIFDIGFCYNPDLSNLVENLFLSSLRESPITHSLKTLKLSEAYFKESYSDDFVELSQSLSSVDTLQVSTMRTLDLLRQIPSGK